MSIKLTEELVRHLRREHRAGRVSVRAVGQLYEMSAEAVRRMLRGETWAHVKEYTEASSDEVESSLARLQAELARGTAKRDGLNAELDALSEDGTT